MIIRNFFSAASALQVAHAGKGKINNTQLYSAVDFSSNLQFIIYSELKPGTSIGYHTHQNNVDQWGITRSRRRRCNLKQTILESWIGE
jgi:hypothetical protein